MGTGGTRPRGDAVGGVPKALPEPAWPPAEEPRDERAAEHARRAVTSSESAEQDHNSFMAGLFGRGLVYVAITAMPILTATIVSPVLAHVLDPDEFGQLASAIALHQVLMAVAIFGVDQALILVRAETGSDRAPRMLVTVGTVVALAFTLIMVGTVGLWSGPLGFRSAHALAVATVSWTVPTVFLELGLALLMAQDRLRLYAVVSILFTVGSQLIGLLFLAVSDHTSVVYAWGGLAGRMVAVVMCVLFVRPLWARRRDLPVLRGAFALGLPITLSALSMFVLNSGDRLVIQRLLGSAEAGRYQIAYTIGFEAITVFAYTGEAWAARFTGVEDDDRRWHLLGQARDHLYELLAPALLAVNLAAPLLLRIFAPEAFRPAGLVLVVWLVSLCGVPCIAILGSTRALITQRRTRPIAVGAGAAAVANLGLNFLLVPLIGLPGAALASVVAFIVQAVVQRVVFRPFRAWPRTRISVFVRLLLTSGVAGGFVLVDQSPRWIAVRTGLAVLCGLWLIVTYLRGRASHTATRGRHAAS